MDRAQFMEQLQKLLSDISEAERQEALDYYNSYFDDAGKENEEAVIRELGSPGKVAAIIKADLKESNDAYAEYSEYGYEDTRTKEPGQMPDRRNKEQSRSQRGYHAEKKPNHARTILVLILLVFLAPFLSGAVGGIFGVAIAIAFLPFILVFVLGACTLGFLVAGIVCGISGIALCFSYPPAGILTVGIGFIMVAVAILFLVALVWAAGRLLPRLLNKFTELCHNILQRERKVGKS